MTRIIPSTERLRIARSLLQFAGEDHLRDAAALARALWALDLSPDHILSMPEAARLPDTREWLEYEFSRCQAQAEKDGQFGRWEE